jgi:hypothetical protein
VNLQSVVDELTERIHDAREKVPSDLLQNRWLHLGLAAAIGYAIGRTRSRVHLGPFAKTLATAAVTTLIRTAMSARGHNSTTTN